MNDTARVLLRKHRPPMPARRNQTGYSLIELMVVVAIVAVVAAMAVPGMTRGLRERRKTRATHDVVRVFETARRMAIQNGRAHLVRVSETAYSGRGSIEIYRGDSHRCNGNDWTAMTATACSTNLRCMKDASWDPTEFETQGSLISLDVVNAGLTTTELDLCYDGLGVMWWRAGTSGSMGDTPTLLDDAGSQVLGAFRFEVTSTVNGVAQGVTRRVIVPFGGEARYVR